MLAKSAVILFVFSLIFSCTNKERPVVPDGKMSYDDFKNLTLYYEQLMEDSIQSFSVGSAVQICKIHNSIALYYLSQNDPDFWMKFEKKFSGVPFDRILNLLEMQVSIGMTYYSKRYDISLGASPGMKNSYFEINDLTIPK